MSSSNQGHDYIRTKEKDVLNFNANILCPFRLGPRHHLDGRSLSLFGEDHKQSPARYKWKSSATT